jgi:hypothetical protein
MPLPPSATAVVRRILDDLEVGGRTLMAYLDTIVVAFEVPDPMRLTP